MVRGNFFLSFFVPFIISVTLCCNLRIQFPPGFIYFIIISSTTSDPCQPWVLPLFRQTSFISLLDMWISGSMSVTVVQSGRLLLSIGQRQRQSDRVSAFVSHYKGGIFSVQANYQRNDWQVSECVYGLPLLKNLENCFHREQAQGWGPRSPPLEIASWHGTHKRSFVSSL